MPNVMIMYATMTNRISVMINRGQFWFFMIIGYPAGRGLTLFTLFVEADHQKNLARLRMMIPMTSIQKMTRPTLLSSSLSEDSGGSPGRSSITGKMAFLSFHS
jgi:hypothetical protein